MALCLPLEIYCSSLPSATTHLVPQSHFFCRFSCGVFTLSVWCTFPLIFGSLCCLDGPLMYWLLPVFKDCVSLPKLWFSVWHNHDDKEPFITFLTRLNSVYSSLTSTENQVTSCIHSVQKDWNRWRCSLNNSDRMHSNFSGFSFAVGVDVPFSKCVSLKLWLIYSPQSWRESFRCHNVDRVALWRRGIFPGGTDGYAPSQIVLGEMRGVGVECVVVVLICMGWEGLLLGEYEEMKALFVLRGKGEWVQLYRLLSDKERLSGLWWSSCLSNFDWFSFATHSLSICVSLSESYVQFFFVFLLES